MKKMILTMVLAFSFILAFALPRYTADYFVLDAEKYLNKEVTLRIASATLLRESHFIAKNLKKEGYTLYSCGTAYKGEYGGNAYILVPSKKAKTFYTTYTKGNDRMPYRATMKKVDELKKVGEEYYFEGK